MFKGKKVTAIIVAAGQGKRFGSDLPKQFFYIGGETVLEKALLSFENNSAVDKIVVVTGGDFIVLCKEICKKFSKADTIVQGGTRRQDSVEKGLKHVDDGLVLIHDGARPFATAEIIDRVLEEAYNQGAAVPCVPVKETIRQTYGSSSITLDRSTLFNVQTPQGFEVQLIKKAFNAAYNDGFYGTDDASLVERLGKHVELVEGDYANIKITTKEDLPDMGINMRIGTGYDVHRMDSERKLILGGVEIPHEKGLLGHSDADVLLHALMDAMLGAAGMGDIGRHFPDSDQKYKDISSLILLKHVKSLINDAGFEVGNADITVIAQRPKIAPYIPYMEKNIAEILEIDIDRINVKGTTTERLGFTGREEGIAAQAVCILFHTK